MNHAVLCSVLVCKSVKCIFDVLPQVSVLFRAEDCFCHLAAVTVHKGLQCPVPQVCAPHAVQQRKGLTPHTLSDLLAMHIQVVLNCVRVCVCVL